MTAPPLLLLLLLGAVPQVCYGQDDTCRLLCTSCEKSRIVFASQCSNLTCPCLNSPSVLPPKGTIIRTDDAEKSTEKPREPEGRQDTFVFPTRRPRSQSADSIDKVAENQGPQQPDDCPNPERFRTTYCPNGHIRDAKGCITGDCAPPAGCITPDQWSQRCGIRDTFCPQGHQVGRDGCPSCQCVGCPRLQLPPCTNGSTVRCTMADGCLTDCQCGKQCSQEPQCSNDCGLIGYETDQSGCRVSCACRCKEDTCPQGKCSGGYGTDRFGCRFCKLCVTEEENPWWCFSKPPPCEKSCGAHGFRRDRDGCRVDCECQCPELPDDCPAHCAWGRAKDKFGCDTCQCMTLQQSQQVAGCSMPDWLRENCEQHCVRRYDNRWLRLDQRGCSLCRCCGPSKCPNLNCPMDEPVRDLNGCPTCSCYYSDMSVATINYYY